MKVVLCDYKRTKDKKPPGLPPHRSRTYPFRSSLCPAGERPVYTPGETVSRQEHRASAREVEITLSVSVGCYVYLLYTSKLITCISQ